MTVTSEDVARLAGVSRGAVSQILNGRGGRFPESTRLRVRQAAAELEYQPSVAGRALALGTSDIVIALIPHATFGGNLQDVFEALTDTLASRGLTLLLRLSTSSPLALSRAVAGIKPRAVLSIAGFTADELAMLAEQGIPAIQAPAAADNPIRQIAITQVRHLVERGHTRLAFAHLQDKREEFEGSLRAEAFALECRAHGLSDPVIVELDLELSSADRALDALAGAPVAVGCYNDDVATAMLAAAMRRGLKVPDEFAVIGLDHTPLSRLTSPVLTTIEYDLASIVDSTTRWVLAALDRPDDAAVVSALGLRVVQGGTT